MKKGHGKKVTLADGSKITQFEHKWGISALHLAKLEGVSGATVHMRVMNFGTPFQRRAKLTKWEKKYGKTMGQLALDIGIHPITVAHREALYGSPYVTPERTMTDSKTGEKIYPGEWNLNRPQADTHWTQTKKWQTATKSTFFTLEDILKP